MKPQKSNVGKDRYREVVEFQESYNRNDRYMGKQERVWFTGTDSEHGQTVGRTKAFAKVLVERDDTLLGCCADVRIDRTCRLHTEGRLVDAVSKLSKDM